MKVLLLVLNQVNKLDEVINALKKDCQQEGTVFDSTQTNDVAVPEEEVSYFKSLRRYLNPERAPSKVLLYFVSNEKVSQVRATLEKTISEKDGEYAFINAD